MTMLSSRGNVITRLSVAMAVVSTIVCLAGGTSSFASDCFPDDTSLVVGAFNHVASPGSEMADAGDAVIADTEGRGVFSSGETITRLIRVAHNFGFEWDCATSKFVRAPVSTPRTVDQPSSKPGSPTPPAKAPAPTLISEADAFDEPVVRSDLRGPYAPDRDGMIPLTSTVSFPTSGYVHVGSGSKWCLVHYTSRTSTGLTGLRVVIDGCRG